MAMEELTKRGEANRRYINRFTAQQWVEVMKELYLCHELFINDKDADSVRKAANYEVKYNDGKIEEIRLHVTFNTERSNVNLILSVFHISFEKSVGGGQYKEFNRIPIDTFSVMERFDDRSAYDK